MARAAISEREAETRRPIPGAPRGRAHDLPPATLANLRHERSLAAYAVLHYGEAYLGIFERMDRECQALEQREALRARVLAVAAEGGRS